MAQPIDPLSASSISSPQNPSSSLTPFKPADLPGFRERLAETLLKQLIKMPDKTAEWAGVGITIATMFSAGLTAALAWAWVQAHLWILLGAPLLIVSFVFFLFLTGLRQRELRLLSDIEKDRAALVKTTKEEIVNEINEKLTSFKFLWVWSPS